MSVGVIAIHGGAGTISRNSISLEREKEYHNALENIITQGQSLLAQGGSAFEAVALAVSLLEDSPLFNAGRGSVYTSDAKHEMDAAIMDGSSRKAGAVCCVSLVKNPIKAARIVMENTNHVLMTSEGAHNFLKAHGAEFAGEDYFYTDFRMEQLRQMQKEQKPGVMILDHDGQAKQDGNLAGQPLDEKKKFGTVGAVALDANGHLAAATSTGGMTNKLPGRVGDTPMIGAGCYANDLVAVSCTGIGEFFMRQITGHDIAARMAYKGIGLEQACQEALEDLRQLGGSGGLIAIDKHGNVNLPFISEGMYRASGKVGEAVRVGIYREWL